MADDKILWEEPPPIAPKGRKEPKYAEFFGALRDNPGKWAKFPGEHTHRGVAAAIPQGTYSGTTPGEFEAASRVNPDSDPKTYSTYVRYVGATEESA